MAKTKQVPKLKRFGFVDYLEAWITGVNYGRAHPATDGERLLKAAQDAYEQSGGERAQQTARKIMGDAYVADIDLTMLTDVQRELIFEHAIPYVLGLVSTDGVYLARQMEIPLAELQKHRNELREIFKEVDNNGDHG